jgi:hypothetical protein
MFTGDTFKVINNIYNKYYNFKKIQVSQGLHCTTEGFNIVLVFSNHHHYQNKCQYCCRQKIIRFAIISEIILLL